MSPALGDDTAVLDTVVPEGAATAETYGSPQRSRWHGVSATVGDDTGGMAFTLKNRNAILPEKKRPYPPQSVNQVCTTRCLLTFGNVHTLQSQAKKVI